uniref:SUEL-type lectin domain-containing protein n=1 Tax=Salarias fasciatus TaxID=181472 RepID=A0A672HA61_SALFA
VIFFLYSKAQLKCGKVISLHLCFISFRIPDVACGAQAASLAVSSDLGKVISVVKANYGRLDSKKCSRRRPGLRLFSPTQVCILRCNGKRRCSIRAVNSVFGDPCRGTYKYLEVDYVCQGEHSVVSSDAGQVISIIKANYGRLDGRKCARGRPKSQLNNVKCSNPANKVSNQYGTCDGKQTCSIRASNSVFGDPCRGTYKYLEVDYICQGLTNVVSCEGSAAVLKYNCGVITVKSAYYGRRDRTTCSEGRPAAQLRNSQCFNPTGKVAESCDGKTTCIIRASNSVFGDPCGGTYKYLEVDYTCEREFGSDCSHLYGGRRFTALIQHKAAAATQNPEPGFREAA